MKEMISYAHWRLHTQCTVPRPSPTIRNLPHRCVTSAFSQEELINQTRRERQGVVVEMISSSITLIWYFFKFFENFFFTLFQRLALGKGRQLKKQIKIDKGTLNLSCDNFCIFLYKFCWTYDGTCPLIAISSHFNSLFFQTVLRIRDPVPFRPLDLG